MDYYSLSFTSISAIPTEIVNDILSAELGEIGFESFEEKENVLLAYIPATLYANEAIDTKLADFPLPDVEFNYEIEFIKAKNWK